MASVLQLLPALPKARRWVHALLDEHRPAAKPVSAFEMRRLRACWPAGFLDSSRVAVVDRTPALPLEDWGMHGLEVMSPEQTSGITFDDVFFVATERAGDESLFFHELVHVVQWRRLGVSRFLTIYGIGLLQHGYRHSPLEQMAYDLQARFDAGEQFDAHRTATAACDALVRTFARQRLDHRVALWLSRVL